MDSLFAHADLIVIVVYMAAMLLIGFLVSDGSRDVEGYSIGNREMNGWVVGLSVLGTFLSSITFLALPAFVYEKKNWSGYVFGMALPIAAWIAVQYFIPLYRRHVNLSAYEFLEHRFGYWARGYVAASFTVLQMIRIAMVNLLVALAVDPLLGWGVIPTSIVIGVVVIIYDVMGGIKAVIWTDVAQVFVLLGGALWCLFEIIRRRPGGGHAVRSRSAGGVNVVGDVRQHRPVTGDVFDRVALRHQRESPQLRHRPELRATRALLE